MIFGTSDTFAIEIGAVESFPKAAGLFVQFRFWACNVPMGDWNDRIPLISSIENARTICATGYVQRAQPFGQSLDTEVFQKVYDGFFSYDYLSNPIENPNRRDCFHLDGIGMGAIEDKYGLVVVASSTTMERVIAKDLKQERMIVDVSLPIGFVETALNEYICWGTTQLLEVAVPPT